MDGISYVVSLKYSPVMWNIGQGLGEPIRSTGQPVRYLFSSSYDWLVQDRDQDQDQDQGEDIRLLPVPDVANPLRVLLSFIRSGGARRIREIFREQPPRLLLFVNLNPFVDRMAIRIAREINPEVRVVTLLHEPHTTQKLIYGWRRAFLLTIFEFLTRRMTSLSDAVILPSEQAREVFERFYPGFRGTSRVIPLPIPDERHPEELERRYISFVGHIGNAHQKGIDLFLGMLEESLDRSGEYFFQLVTGEDPGALLASLSDAARKKLRVVHGTPLTDQEIGRAIRESIAVVLLQRRVMQSGVVPIALMNGTPIIASDLKGFTQFIENGQTGCILPVDPSLDQRFEAVDSIRNNLDKISAECRKLYEETFDSRAVVSSVPFILGLPESDRDPSQGGGGHGAGGTSAHEFS